MVTLVDFNGQIFRREEPHWPPGQPLDEVLSKAVKKIRKGEKWFIAFSPEEFERFQSARRSLMGDKTSIQVHETQMATHILTRHAPDRNGRFEEREGQFGFSVYP